MINDFVKLVMTVTMMLTLSACGVYIDNVRQTPNSKLVVLKSTYEFTRDRNTPFCDETFTYRAIAGTYYPEFEDNNGVYYRGRFGAIEFQPLKVSCMKELPKTTSFEWAGIYLPNDQKSPAKLYVYSGEKPEGYKPVVPEEDQPKNNTNTPHASADVQSDAATGLVPALILAVERNSIQFLRFQAEDDSLRAAITVSEKPAQ